MTPDEDDEDLESMDPKPEEEGAEPLEVDPEEGAEPMEIDPEEEEDGDLGEGGAAEEVPPEEEEDNPGAHQAQVH